MALGVENAVEVHAADSVAVGEEAVGELVGLGRSEVRHQVVHSGEDVVGVVTQDSAAGLMERECGAGFFNMDWRVVSLMVRYGSFGGE